MLEFISLQEIGRIPMGIDGTDIYMLLRTQEPVGVQELRDFFNSQYCTDSHYPGSAYCAGCTVMPKPYYNDEFVVIIHNRYDC